MSEQKLFNTLWIVVPTLMAVLMSACGGKVQVVARGLPTPPVALATDQRPASGNGFFWETHSTPREHLFRTHNSRSVRVTAQPGETLLWCRQVGTAVYSLAGHGPDRLGPPCIIDPPFILRRQPLSGGPVRVVRADLPSASVFVLPSGAVCFADAAGIHRIGPTGGPAQLICRRTDRNVTAWGAAGETLYWIEEAMPGGRDPVGSCRLVSLAPGARRPRLVAWAPDALTDLVVSEKTVVWYHPGGRTLEGVGPDGQVTVLAREINLAETPALIGDRLFYLCQSRSGARELETTSVSAGGCERLARLDASARILGTARDGLYLGEEEGSGFWFSARTRTGRLLRVPFSRS
jgi:hypothetical protein